MEIVILVVVIAVIALGAISGLVISGRKKKALKTEEPATHEDTTTPTAEPHVGEEAEARPEGRAERSRRSASPRPRHRRRPPSAPAAPAEPEIEIPEPTAGRLVRLRARLSRSQNSLGKGLLTLLSREHLDEETWEEVEDTLLTADVGVGPTQELVERLRERVRVLGTRTPQDLRDLLREELLTLIGTDLDRTVHTETQGAVDRPGVVLVVGVNGTGKTTTSGKLARVLVADGKSVVLGAADTFRAAAADQLETWGTRVGARTVRGPEGGDPASVAFDAVKQGTEAGADVVLIDTAGRLHTKTGLMDELGKVKRVVEKQGPVDEVLLVLDATTGQNGLVQARVFAEVVDITGIVLTKLDGTAKGGIVVAVQRELGVPVKLVGPGRGRRRPGAVRAGGVRGRPGRRGLTAASDQRSGLICRCTEHTSAPSRRTPDAAATAPPRSASALVGDGGAVADVGERAQQEPRLRRVARRLQRGRTQPPHRSEPAEVGGRRGDVLALAPAAQIEVGVVPAHPVEQLGQFGGGSGGDQEPRPAVRRRRDRAQRHAHPLQPHQGALSGRLGHLDHVEETSRRKQQRRSRDTGPGFTRLREGGTGGDLQGRVQRVGPGGGAGDGPARALHPAAGAGGAGARDHVPAPQPRVLRDSRARRGATAPA